MKLDRHRPVEAFIEKLKGFSAKRTIRCYRSTLKSFFKIINKDPNDYIVDIKKLNGEERENTIEVYEDDVEKYWLALKDKAPCTRSCNISNVKMFLSEFDIELSTKFWKNISRRSPPSEAITDDIAPTNEQMKKILQHADLKGRALFLILYSSGTRIGEMLQLEPGDIDLEKDPVRINVRAETTKTGRKRITFMSNEARDALIEWLKVRDDYLQAAVRKCNVVPSHERQNDGKMKMVPVKKSLDDPRIFPFSYGTARKIWNRLLENAGLAGKDRRTNYYKMHMHCMRKSFSTNMPGYIGAKGEKITEALMGHEGYLARAYRRLSEPELAEGYKRGVHGLLIFEKGEDMEKMRDLEEETEMQRSVMKRQEGEIIRMTQETDERAQKVLLEAAKELLSNNLEFRKVIIDAIATGKKVQSPEVRDKVINIETKRYKHLETEDKKKKGNQTRQTCAGLGKR